MHLDQIFNNLQRNDPWYKEPVQKPEEPKVEPEVQTEESPVSENE